MPLQEKSIAVKLAVLSFFGVCIVGMIAGVPVETCSWRGSLAAIVTYIVAGWLVKAANRILTEAMVASWMQQPVEEDTVDDES